MRTVVVDYETVEIQADGSLLASTEAYRPNFRVTSCAYTEEINGALISWYTEGEDATRVELRKLEADQSRIVAHNIQYEILCTKCRFPEVSLNWYADSMRLSQVYDNGGDSSDFVLVLEEDVLEPGDRPKVTRKPTEGFSLVKCTQRILGDTSDHKKEAHDYIKKLVPNVKPKSVGSYLHLLPSDVMERYNVADTETTYRLYKHCVDYFTYIGYDWSLDHRLFLSLLNPLVDSQIRGVRVNRVGLEADRKLVAAEIVLMGTAFRARFKAEIEAVEADRLELFVSGKIKAKKPEAIQRTKDKRLARYKAGAEKALKAVQFNPGSNDQLAALFTGKLDISPVFFTDKGKPSFKSSMLHQWGEGGGMLQARRKRMLVLKQQESLLELSAFDGRWHLAIKLVGTATGRLAGGSSQ